MESFGRVVEIFITVVLIFIMPVQYFAIKQDMISQTYLTTETSYLVDSVRNLGYLNKEMYETYLRKINTTGNVYDVEMIHYEYVFEANGEDYAKHCYCTYQEEILNLVYDETKELGYRFHQGDYFVIKINNKNRTYSSFIQELLMGIHPPTEQIRVVYGGAIRDEVN